MTDQLTPTSPTSSGENKKNSNCFLKGCLIVLTLFVLVLCCLGTLVAVPFVTDFNPLGQDWQNRIMEIIPWEDFIQDPSLIPVLQDLFDEGFDLFLEEGESSLDFLSPGVSDPTGPASDARAIPLATYTASDFPATFSYPAGWEIEEEAYEVIFSDPHSFTFLHVGEELVADGTTADQISSEVIESIQSEAESGTFILIETSPWSVPTGDDAYLSAYEWTDSEGYNLWAYDLETVSGESNIYIFLAGEDPELAPIYGELIKIIADSFSR